MIENAALSSSVNCKMQEKDAKLDRTLRTEDDRAQTDVLEVDRVLNTWKCNLPYHQGSGSDWTHPYP